MNERRTIDSRFRMVAPARTLVTLALLALAPVLAVAQAPAPVDGEAAFERIKGLAGIWKAPGDGKGPGAEVRYEITAAGRAVIERQYAGADQEMVSVYYLDEDRLVLTHYCTTGNQPRLRLDTAASTPDDLRFTFDGGTNLGSTYAPHLHQGALRFQAEGKVEAEWLFFIDGKPAKAPVKLALQRQN